MQRLAAAAVSAMALLTVSLGAQQAGGDLGRLRYTIAAPPPPYLELELNRDLLPKGARGKFASYDGDGFTVSFPARVSGAMDADAVFREIVAPLMRGMGFGARVADMRPPRQAPFGVVQPGANVAAIAEHVCRERESAVCEAMKTGETNAAAERELSLAFGMSFVQFQADLERRRFQYVFRQVAGGEVPIEHMGVIAERADGQNVTAVYGALFNRYRITNSRALRPDQAVASGTSRLLRMGGLVDARQPAAPTALVLLPYGTTDTRDAIGTAVDLRYAYRTVLYARPAPPAPSFFSRRTRAAAPPGVTLSWMAWIDAATGALLQLAPQFDAQATSKARGRSWKRDPNKNSADDHTVRPFLVDKPVDGRFILRRAGIFERMDRFGDKVFDDEEVSIPDDGLNVACGPSKDVVADFCRSPLNNYNQASCASSGNNTFRQINLYAHVHAFREAVAGAMTVPSFPEKPIAIHIDLDGDNAFGDYDFPPVPPFTPPPAFSLLRFSVGTGFEDKACPNVGVLPTSTDATVIAHEMGHLLSKRLGLRRPADWCGDADCELPQPASRDVFHDFADAWAQAYASTPCVGGWAYKNEDGPNANLHCAQHKENGDPPRYASVSEPFVTGSAQVVQDHFPEKRIGPADTYKNGEIAATALWLTRQGLRSKSMDAGAVQYWTRLHRAVYAYGMGPPKACAGCDLEVYEYGRDLLNQLMLQWVPPGTEPQCAITDHQGANMVNKILSAFARVGFFLTPALCIDRNGNTGDGTYCPGKGGEGGGDAIIDVFDGTSADDVKVEDVVVPEEDYILRHGKAPTFRVWTGPRFKFSSTGVASDTTPATCHTLYRVDLSLDPHFPVASTVGSGWKNVPPGQQCYDTWNAESVWAGLLDQKPAVVKVYYRVLTRGGTSDEKISTSPGSGSYEVPPPFVVLNQNGRP